MIPRLIRWRDNRRGSGTCSRHQSFECFNPRAGTRAGATRRWCSGRCGWLSFNPRAGTRAGATPLPATQWVNLAGFNPRAGTRAGATSDGGPDSTFSMVSIHAPALVPARPWEYGANTNLSKFQSTRRHSCRRDMIRRRRSRTSARFNPRAGTRAGATVRHPICSHQIRVSIHAPALVPARRNACDWPD